MMELWVCATSRVARINGFNPNTHRHRDRPDLMVWYPGLQAERLYGLRFATIIIDGDAQRYVALSATAREREEWRHARHIMRERLEAGGLCLEG